MPPSLSGWPDVVSVLWDPGALSPNSCKLGALGMFLVWAMWALLRNLVLIAVVPLMGDLNPWAG